MSLAHTLSSIRVSPQPLQSPFQAIRSKPSNSTLQSAAFSIHCNSLRSRQKNNAFSGRTNLYKCVQIRSQVAVENGESSSSQESNSLDVGARIIVTGDCKVYHVPKVPELNLNGLEGEITQVLLEWKGKPVSATFPYKVKFATEINGVKAKFFAHLKDDEFKAI